MFAHTDPQPSRKMFDDEADFAMGRSPFRPPNDEEVFVTRETEKQKKMQAK